MRIERKKRRRTEGRIEGGGQLVAKRKVGA
jgi:hypothetical protein